MDLIYILKRLLNKIYYKQKARKKDEITKIETLQITGDLSEENTEEREKSNIIEVSDELKKYLNSRLLYAEKNSREIREYDIKEIIDLISEKNKTRTNEIKIDAQIADEFVSILEDEIEKKSEFLEQEKFALGELEVDISNKEFKIEEFVNKHKNISYILKLKISSLKDLAQSEMEFLNTRYGIVYDYSGEEYHLDELIEVNNKLSKFIPEKNVECSLETAQEILDNVFKNFELYVPKEYIMKDKTVKLVNGEKLNLPNFKVVENAEYYSKLENIFNNQKASEKGYRKVCREALKIAGFDVIANIESFTNTIKKYDVIISDQKYRIDIDEDGIRLVG